MAAQVMPVAKSLNIHLHHWLSRIWLSAIAAPRLQPSEGRSRGCFGKLALNFGLIRTGSHDEVVSVLPSGLPGRAVIFSHE